MTALGPDVSEGDLLTYVFSYAWEQDMSQEASRTFNMAKLRQQHFRLFLAARLLTRRSAQILFDTYHPDGVTLEDAKSTILELVAGIRRKLGGPPKGQVVSVIMHNSVSLFLALCSTQYATDTTLQIFHTLKVAGLGMQRGGRRLEVGFSEGWRDLIFTFLTNSRQHACHAPVFHPPIWALR